MIRVVWATFAKSIKYLVARPYTRQVPRIDKPFKTSVLRGAHILDMNKCTGCGMCQIMCPAACIDFVVVEGDYPQNPKKRFPRIDQSKCTFCGLCVEYCPFNALFMTMATGFELFTTDKSKTFKEPTQLKGDVKTITVSRELFLGAYEKQKKGQAAR